MTDDQPGEVRKVEAFVPVSAEVLADGGFLVPLSIALQPRTPAEREALVAHVAQRAAASEALRADVEARHLAVVERLDGVARQVAEHHRPHVEPGWHRAECRGCDGDGYEWEPPEWPCSTYDLVSASPA